MINILLGLGAYLRYEIPYGSADAAFALNEKDNTVIVKKSLDREAKDKYVIPIYVKDIQAGRFDSAVIMVNVVDVNDNVPLFLSGSCYPLYVPENMESSVIHTVVAIDRDVGNNGKIVYSITGKNCEIFQGTQGPQDFGCMTFNTFFFSFQTAM